jgi:hypothetical protein
MVWVESACDLGLTAVYLCLNYRSGDEIAVEEYAYVVADIVLGDLGK